jgi:hypothetical protein
MNKIRIVSGILRFLFTVLLVLLPAYTIVYWLSNGYPFGHWVSLSVFPWSETAPKLPEVETLTPTVKVVAFIFNMIPIAIYMLILYFLIQLFRLYQSNQIFSISCVRNIRRIGWMMLVNQIIHPFYTFMLSATMTYNLPPGFRFGYIGIFNLPKLMAIVVAVLIILISWIMEEGHRIYEENSYTV